MNQDKIATAAHNMIKYGGSFHSSLGRALLVADNENQQKILNEWRDDVRRYAEM